VPQAVRLRKGWNEKRKARPLAARWKENVAPGDSWRQVRDLRRGRGRKQQAGAPVFTGCTLCTIGFALTILVAGRGENFHTRLVLPRGCSRPKELPDREQKEHVLFIPSTYLIVKSAIGCASYGVPRINPLPQRELDICRRLRLWRERSGHTRAHVAAMVRLDSGILTAIEHERSPMRYDVAARLSRAGLVNPLWLATGKSEMALRGIRLPEPAEINSSPRELFSLVYDTRLADDVRWQAIQEENPEANPELLANKEMAVEWLERRAGEWCDTVPPEHLVTFLAQINREANRLLSAYNPARPPRQEIAPGIIVTHSSKSRKKRT